MALTRSEAFGLAVRQTRVKHGLSQEEAALASGIDRAYLGHIERASKSPTLKTIWKITDALDTPLSELAALAEKLAQTEA